MLPTGVAWLGEVSGSIDWPWNHNFELASETIAGEAIEFSYDDDGLLAGAGPLTIDRDPANGRITGSTLGATTDDYVYDSEGRLTVGSNGKSNASTADAHLHHLFDRLASSGGRPLLDPVGLLCRKPEIRRPL